MLFEFPLWFAPGFYELDLSESVILMGGFAMGPWAAVIIEFLKNLLNLLLNAVFIFGLMGARFHGALYGRKLKGGLSFAYRLVG